MPRVTMLVNSDYAHDARVQKEALSLSRAGYDVTVFSLAMPGPRERYFNNIRVLNPTTGKMAWFPYKPVYMKAYWQVMRALLGQGGDIWHGHDLESLPFVFLASKLRGGRLVYDAHELWQGHNWLGGGRWRRPRRLLRRIWLGAEKKLARRCHLVITVSASCARKMAASLNIKTPLVLRNCVDPAGEYSGAGPAIREKLGLAPGETIVVYSGHLKKGRGLEKLLEAWAAARVRAHLVFVGSGPLEEALRALVSSSGLPNVHFISPVKAWELPGFIRGASLGVVLTENNSLNSYCSLPNKVFEYIGAGLPVLATNLPEIRGLVQQYQVGLCVNTREPKAIRVALETLLSGKDKLAAMRQNTRQVGEELSWRREASKLINAYNKVLN